MKSLIVIIFGCMLLVSTCSRTPLPPDSEVPTAPDNQVPEAVQELIKHYGLDDEGVFIENFDGLDSIPTELIEGCDVYVVTFIWGALYNSSTPPGVTMDWSGTLGINADGVVHVRNTIDFESGQDSILIHDNPTFAAWISYTDGDFDGINFLVFFNNNYEYFAVPMLTFDTEQINLSFNFYQLISLDAYYQIDNVHGVVVHARRLWHNVCPGGLMEGRWLKDESFGWTGSFHGMWLNYLGQEVGYLDGIYWRDDDANYMGRLTGTVSGLETDEIIAELNGFWIYDDPRMCPMCGSGHGLFWGTFSYANEDGSSGVFGGEFGDWSLPPNDLDMPFFGIWRIYCPWGDYISVSE